MKTLFVSILKLGLAGSYAILLVLAVRFLIRRFPKIFSYVLWAVVLFRLICPLSLKSAYSIVPQNISYPELAEFKETLTLPISENLTEHSAAKEDYFFNDAENSAVSIIPARIIFKAKVQTPFDWLNAASFVWLAGALGLVGYSIISYLRLKRILRNSRQEEAGVYINDTIVTPFVMGLIKPRIYLPKFIEKDEKEYILLHEQTHIQRKDYLVKPIAFAALTLHWFNPLVWAAFFAMSQDMEMSCDEAVLRKLGTHIKKDYSSSLLKMASQKNIFNASPLAFSDHHVKNRITNILNYRKPAFWMILLCAAATLGLSLGLAGNQRKTPQIEKDMDKISAYLPIDLAEFERLDDQIAGDTSIIAYQREIGIRKDQIYLIYRSGTLSECYLNFAAFDTERLSGIYLTAEAAMEKAGAFVQQVFGREVQFEDLVDLEHALDGYICTFTAKEDGKTILASISLTTGQICYAGILDASYDTWTYYKNQNYNLIDKEDLLFVEYTGLNQIMLYTKAEAENILFLEDRSSVQLLDDDTAEILKRTEKSQLNNSCQKNFEAVNQAEILQLLQDWRGNIQLVSSENARETLTESRMKLLSDQARKKAQEEENGWIKTWENLEAYLSWDKDKNENMSFQHSLEGNGMNYLLHYTFWPETKGVSETDSMRELVSVIEENGCYKIDHYVFLPDETEWGNNLQNSIQTLSNVFIEVMETKDSELLASVMPCSKYSVVNLDRLFSTEYQNISMEEYQLEKDHALVKISAQLKDEPEKTREYYLQMLYLDTKEESGWILYDYNTEIPKSDWWTGLQ